MLEDSRCHDELNETKQTLDRLQQPEITSAAFDGTGRETELTDGQETTFELLVPHSVGAQLRDQVHQNSK